MTLQSSDYVAPFYIDQARVRGRFVRLGDEARIILNRHNYPAIINQYLTEMMTLAAALVTDFKHNGVFTLQIMGKDAPVRLMVVDFSSTGDFRACAKFDTAELETFLVKRPDPKPFELFGQGYMLFAVDLDASDERYQAVVELTGTSLSECVQRYFRQSQQIPTAVISFSCPKENNLFVGASLLIQRLPSDQNATPEEQEQSADDWFTNVSLMATIKKEEMLDKDLSSDQLLTRLFHERQLVCLPHHALTFSCYCSRQRLEDVLSTFPESDIQEMRIDDTITADCDFCGEHYIFDAKQFLKS